MMMDDQKARSVLVKLPNRHTAHYSIKLLYPLEIQTTHLGSHQPKLPATAAKVRQDETVDSGDISSNEAQSVPTSSRPIRQAAIKQQELLRSKLKEGSL